MKRILIIVLLTIVSSNLFAKARVNQIDHKIIKDQTIELRLKYRGEFDGKPELLTRDNIVQVTLPGAVVWPQIERKIVIDELKEKEATVLAYQFDKNTVRFRVLMPFPISENSQNVKMSFENGILKLDIPESIRTQNTKVSDFDEKYLDKLLDDKSIEQVKDNDFSATVKKEEFVKEDNVSTTQSSATKTDSFAFGAYVAKFGFFLGVVLLLFYGVVNLFKKGVLKKGKFSMLENLKTIEVLNSTYLGPKKQLHLIKAHKQVFLVASDEKGIHFLSEISDINGLIKDSQKELVGSNFDSNLDVANADNKVFKIKTSINESANSSSISDLDNFLETNDKSKMSDQIKNKLKSLKPLQ